MGALTTGKVVNTPIGQLIIATCVIDDIIGMAAGGSKKKGGLGGLLGGLFGK